MTYGTASGPRGTDDCCSNWPKAELQRAMMRALSSVVQSTNLKPFDVVALGLVLKFL